MDEYLKSTSIVVQLTQDSDELSYHKDTLIVHQKYKSLVRRTEELNGEKILFVVLIAAYINSGECTKQTECMIYCDLGPNKGLVSGVKN